MIEIAIVCALIVLVILWNLYKPLRARMRGFSTIIEGAIGTLLIYLEVFSEAIQEGQALGFLPDWISQHAAIFVFGWIVLKRIQTSSTVGRPGG